MSKKLSMRWSLRGTETIHLQVEGASANRSYGLSFDLKAQEVLSVMANEFVKWAESNIKNDTVSLSTDKQYTRGVLKITKDGTVFIRLNKSADWQRICTCSNVSELMNYVKANAIDKKKLK